MLANQPPTMTETETPTVTETAAEIIAEPITQPVIEPAKKVKMPNSAFLGLCIPTDLKSKIVAAAKRERRSMSNFAVNIFEEHFATK